MKCAKAQELFSSYLEKTIQPPMGVAFEQHLAECAQCKAEYEKFHAAVVVLDELPMVEPPSDLHALVMARIEQVRKEKPAKVRWLHFDWQSVFTVRVPVKALAMSAALLLIFVLLVQLTPLNSITANIFGWQKASKALPNDQNVGPRILPWGVTSEKRAEIGGGLLVSVKASSVGSSGTVYSLKFGVSEDSALVQVYLLPDGSLGSDVRSNELTKVFDGNVLRDKGAVVPITITQPSVLMIAWRSNGRLFSEFVFVPSAFGAINKSASKAIPNARVFDILKMISADSGVVILAPGDIADKTADVEFDASAAADSVAGVTRQLGLSTKSLGSLIFVLK